eukprot:CAMPEP_0172508072 /NCGR_PEP_ID=MMETSP1066-20121228/208995_1 /TAXON_ID=671091 /ORGANISM="Coscinodiscus wailesii, Strain CCMP2513" /LENGTH=356 /DNA_ID=CAMNT_0013285887 /DNA_START=238 /DNA_END=1305 /DNA_ORIENTATION=+
MAKIRKRNLTPKAIPHQSVKKQHKKSLDFNVLAPNKNLQKDHDILSESDSDNDSAKSLSSSSSSSSEDANETVDAKKIRLAREYLTKMEHANSSDSSSSDGSSSSDDDGASDPLGRKLARHRSKKDGTIEYQLADKIRTSLSRITCPPTAKDYCAAKHVRYFRGHDLTVTAVALDGGGTSGGATAYSGSKDNSVLSWDTEREVRKETIVPRWDKTDMSLTKNSGEVLALAASDDRRYLAVGGRDGVCKIYDVRASTSSSSKGSCLVQEFKGHRGAITSLAFRRNSLDLYSGSDDRCIRSYDLDQMVYLQTLYGHQAAVTSLSCHRRPVPVSTSRDRTCRVWKLNEESHLIFRGGKM